ncbi:hypothetical protein B739_0685 [Riemerella anatipestifer RA-CH-1]|uniref:Uncharacterized protein n=1 Tax=Riemerella anatipestifer RA-CH-1 TaxID=1228997 RepID=J9R0Q3_RIEAN|nr:hypothetical protein B739_0685 [Riemerella anatipestifer RA-CH-1]
MLSKDISLKTKNSFLNSLKNEFFFIFSHTFYTKKTVFVF